MRVGLRVSSRSSGGGQVFIDRLSAALANADNCYSVTIFLLGASTGDYSEQVETVGVPVPDGAVGRRLSAKGALERALGQHPIDVLISPGTEVTRVEGVPSIMWPLTVAPFESAAVQQLGRTVKGRMRWRLLRQAIKSTTADADAFVFSSHYARGLYRNAVPAIAERPSVILHPAPSLYDHDALTVAKTGRPFALFVSHLYPYKMVKELIEGYSLARWLYAVPHSLVLAGAAVDPGYFRSLQSLVEELNMTDDVIFTGALEPRELSNLYASADMFVFSSLSENAGSYALLDAFRWGLPVLSSSTSSMPEICRDSAGYFDPRDPEQIALEFARIALNGEEHSEMASRSRARGESLPTWEDTASGLLSFLARIL